MLSRKISIMLLSLFCFNNAFAQFVFEAGHPSLQIWLLPDETPFQQGNKPNEARIKLGKKLFFDPRISRDNSISCASCHSPMFGWSDGMGLGVGFKGIQLGRSAPVITNTIYNSIQMWDGRKANLVDQALGPMENPMEMNTDMQAVTKMFNSGEYKRLFNQAYPGEEITPQTAAKAIAAFESTIVSKDSPFDRWVKGDKNAMSKQQIHGFKLFVDFNKGNCSSCHAPPNFTDNGFHNIGLKSHNIKNPDMGRFKLVNIPILKGAFKTPTLRDIDQSAPYFHNGEAKTLLEVVKHYQLGGFSKKDLSPAMKKLSLDEQEMQDIVAFMHALTTPVKPFTLPILPLDVEKQP